MLIFSSLPMIKMYVVGTQKKPLTKVLIMRTHNICFSWTNRRKIFILIPLLSGALTLGDFCIHFLWSVDFFKIDFYKKIFQEYHQSVKQFGLRSGSTFFRARSGSKLFAKVISRRQKSPLAGKEIPYLPYIFGQRGLIKQYRPR